MKKTILATLLFVSGAMPVYALDVGDISSFMYSDATILNKTIKNPTTTGRLVNIRIERISSPQSDGKTIPMESKDELLLSPGSLLLPAESNEMIRFYYNGPQDDIERYYRIIWFDQALSNASKNNATRYAVATASARISTILVVAPRKVKYDYQYSKGEIKNTGNATLRLIAYGPCKKISEKKECKENYYLMPGKTRSFTQVDIENQKARLAFWQADNFIPVK
ncbi:EcpB family pilus assembly chaperone [Kosakonia oryzae]|uniref:EcpB family pilus assembly chaperone n=1 Tax=Kosakonia oryzae TaxID=497725 RepID=UPI001D08C2EF|nr:hypothetical protein [Kosakonia oryzae]UDJ80688.1 hypothetical protein I5186_15955 [Kosakonia oryzae]